MFGIDDIALMALAPELFPELMTGLGAAAFPAGAGTVGGIGAGEAMGGLLSSQIGSNPAVTVAANPFDKFMAGAGNFAKVAGPANAAMGLLGGGGGDRQVMNSRPPQQQVQDPALTAQAMGGGLLGQQAGLMRKARQMGMPPSMLMKMMQQRGGL